MKILLITMILLCFVNPVEASLDYSPVVHRECLNRNIDDFRVAGARRFERYAIRAISQDGDSKGLVDVLEVDCGAFGIFHLQPNKYPLNIGWTGSCAYEDPVWKDNILSLLYSDYGPAVQLEIWKNSVNVAVWPARLAGLNHREVAIVASLANTSPSLARRLGEEHEWDVVKMLKFYMEDRPSVHRQRRVTWILHHLI